VTRGLTLAFDTATDVATCALLEGDALLGERTTVARALLEEVDTLLREADARPEDLGVVVVGTGPGSFTSTRIGLAVARGLGLGLGILAAGVSTLDALASAGPGAFPVVDARRRQVFVPGPRAVLPDDLVLGPGALCVGNGAVRYRSTLERLGAEVPPDDDTIHLPHARLHALLAGEPGDPELLEPIYVRPPDAEASVA
jgi:tRNA threonylcarbamoyl adenosine modification protein YeaZ